MTRAGAARSIGLLCVVPLSACSLLIENASFLEVDAAVDAGAPDAGPPDAGVADLDASPSDGGIVCSPDLRAPDNGSVDRTRGMPGDVATYACTSGYVLAGNGGSNTRRCQADGTWTGTEPTCEEIVDPCTPSPCLHGGECAIVGEAFVCDCGGTGHEGDMCEVPLPCADTLTPPEHGSVDRTSGATGDVATYACDAGYTLDGDATRTCQADGSWSGAEPDCTPSPCAETLAAPSQGAVDRTTGVTGDVAIYTCNEGCTLEGVPRRRCEPDGTWSGVAPTCGHWCWAVPVHGGDVRGIWGLAPDDLWAVSDRETVLHWDGAAWSAVRVSSSTFGSFSQLNGVGGASASRVWAVSDASIYGWDGFAWSPFTAPGATGRLLAVWSDSSGNAWIVGEGGSTFRWDGTAWTNVPSGTFTTLRSVWGRTSALVWAVGDGGTILRWTGSAWSGGASGVTTNLNAIWGDITGVDVWAVGDAGVILRWSGSGWNRVDSGTTANLRSIQGASPSELWVAGDDGTILRWNGSAWSQVPSGTANDLHGAWGSSTSAWAVGDFGTILRWDGATWLPYGPRMSQASRSLWGSSPTSVWSVGDGGSVHRWNGREWNPIASGTSSRLNDVWGSSGTDVWAVGEGGTILRWTGGAWSSVASGTGSDLRALWGSSANDVWAVGAGGVALRWRGSSWAPVTTGTTSSLGAIWGSSATDVWAAGDRGALLRWSGTSWAPVAHPSGTADFWHLWGASSTDVWAQTGSMTMRWNGSSWSSTSDEPGTFVTGDWWGGSSTEIWVAGVQGLVTHWDGSCWRDPERSCGFGGTELGGWFYDAIWGNASDVWFTGATSYLGGEGVALRFVRP